MKQNIISICERTIETEKKMDIDKKEATIYDIAKLTGLSAATVSRTLNGKGYISKETKQSVYEAAEKLNYTPNPAARSLKTRKTNQIMLSTIYLKDYFNFEMIEAIQNVAKSYGYGLLLNFTEDDEKEEIRMLKNARQNFVDGLIIVSMEFTERHIKELEKIRYPVVLVGICKNNIRYSQRTFDFVGVDTEKGLYIATQHLIDQGHRKIGYIGLPSSHRTWDERQQGFWRAMQDNGLENNNDYIITGGFDEAFGFMAGKRIAGMNNRPTAICASTDMIVIGLYKAFQQEGIKIPEEICIIGMDDIELDTIIKPTISSISVAQAEIGRAAAELIFKKLNGFNEPSHDIIFQPKLIIRESSLKKI